MNIPQRDRMRNPYKWAVVNIQQFIIDIPPQYYAHQKSLAKSLQLDTNFSPGQFYFSPSNSIERAFAHNSKIFGNAP